MVVLEAPAISSIHAIVGVSRGHVVSEWRWHGLPVWILSGRACCGCQRLLSVHSLGQTCLPASLIFQKNEIITGLQCNP